MFTETHSNSNKKVLNFHTVALNDLTETQANFRNSQELTGTHRNLQGLTEGLTVT